MTTQARPSTTEVITFVMAAVCAVLGLVVSPQQGGITWLVLLVAALLAWQGVMLRRRRLGPARPTS